MEKKSLFTETEGWTEEGIMVGERIRPTLERVFQEFSDNGYSLREIGLAITTQVRETESFLLLAKRRNKLKSLIIEEET